MLTPLSGADARLVARAVAVLFLVVFFGVTVAENRLNDLTRRHTSPQAFHVTRSADGVYALTLFGQRADAGLGMPVARVEKSAGGLTFTAGGRELAVPTRVSADPEEIREALKPAAAEFGREAARTGANLRSLALEAARRTEEQVSRARKLLTDREPEGARDGELRSPEYR